MSSGPTVEQHLRDLVRLRRVRDRMGREYAQPLDVAALARGAHLSVGHLSAGPSAPTTVSGHPPT